jgi:hypothetical protein
MERKFTPPVHQKLQMFAHLGADNVLFRGLARRRPQQQDQLRADPPGAMTRACVLVRPLTLDTQLLRFLLNSGERTWNLSRKIGATLLAIDFSMNGGNQNPDRPGSVGAGL